jgi:glycosyltransferase involved in cell wall biosynthesis
LISGNEQRRLIFAIPGDIETPSGGYGYDRRVIGELRALGWTVEHLALPSGFPDPSHAELAEAAGQFSSIADDSLVMVDGLAFGAMPDIALAEARRLQLVALVHHPLALETGLTAEAAARLAVSEKTALTAVRGVVVTSTATARTLVADFDVREDSIFVAVPGTAPVEQKSDSDADRRHRSPMILSVGSLTRRKDHSTLISALQNLAGREWRCRIVGSDSMDPATAQGLHRQIAEAGLTDRIRLTGALDDVTAEYRQADIFALASRYEGYGMVFAEAMAYGLPIVGCRGGAIPDVVPESAGMLVEPGDDKAFAAALAVLLDDPQTRRSYASGALEAGRQLPDWPQTVQTLSVFLEAVR